MPASLDLEEPSYPSGGSVDPADSTLQIHDKPPGDKAPTLPPPPPPPQAVNLPPPPPSGPALLANQPLSQQGIMRPIGAGNHDKAWNDPPLFSTHVNTRPSGPRKSKLSERVAFPLGSSSSSSTSPILPPPSTTGAATAPPADISRFLPVHYMQPEIPQSANPSDATNTTTDQR